MTRETSALDLTDLLGPSNSQNSATKASNPYNTYDSLDSSVTPTQVNTASLKLLSHSAIQTLRLCPRKFELDRLYGTAKRDPNTVHTAFGSALGSGIQEILRTNSLQAGVLEAFRSWSIPLDESHARAFKSFPHVVIGLHNFYEHILPDLGDWELATFPHQHADGTVTDRVAIELSFSIALPLGYYYRGFLDGVLYNPVTGKYRVLELKTTGSRNVDEANYSNSFQGVGYSVVLDRIASTGYSDYEVLYLVYKTYNNSFEDYPFLKLQTHRINWLNDLLLTVEMIELFKRTNRFPQNGDACKSYGRLCRFYYECNYANASIFRGAEMIHSLEATGYDPTDFDFNFTYEELLNTQTEHLRRETGIRYKGPQ